MSDQKKYTFVYSTFDEFEKAYNYLKQHKEDHFKNIKKRLDNLKIPFNQHFHGGETLIVDLANLPNGMSAEDILNIEERSKALADVHEKLGIKESI